LSPDAGLSQDPVLSGEPAVAPLGPDSLVWRLGSPRTSLLLAGRALLLQVAHPTVGAGVRDFSDFRSDPWGRLDRTVSSLLTHLYGGERAVAEMRRLHEVHQGIAGAGFDGRPYRASEPGAWAWVHLANADTLLVVQELLGPRLDPGERERYWAEWRQAGLLLGIEPDRLPTSVDALRAYVDEMATTTLGDNETVRILLGTLSFDDVPAPWRLFPRPLWDLLRPLGRTLLTDFTVGTLPPVLRAKLGLEWSADRQRRLERISSVVRVAAAGVPERALHFPIAYRAMQDARRHAARRPG